MSFSDWFRKASPTILTIIGAGGTIFTAVLAAKAAPEAEKRRKEAEAKSKGELTVADIVIAEAPAYAPAAAVGLGTIACIFGANVLNRRQQACLASAYALLERTYGEYKDKVRAIFGIEGDHIVEREIEKDKSDQDDDQPPWDRILTFYYEPYGKFFERTTEQVVMAEYYINRMLAKEGKVTVNDFLDLLDLEHVDGGDENGWNKWDGETIYGYEWIDFDTERFETDDGMVVYSINTPFAPHPEETEFSCGYGNSRNNQGLL